MPKKRHSPEQIVVKLRDADAMLAAGKTLDRRARAWRLVNRRSIAGVPSTAA